MEIKKYASLCLSRLDLMFKLKENFELPLTANPHQGLPLDFGLRNILKLQACCNKRYTSHPAKTLRKPLRTEIIHLDRWKYRNSTVYNVLTFIACKVHLFMNIDEE